MRITIALTLALLAGCGGSQLPLEYPEHAERAEQLDEQLDSASDALATAKGLIPTVCYWRGADSAECGALTASHAIAMQALNATRAAVQLYESTGIAVAEVDAAASKVAGDAQALAAEAQRLSEVVHAEIARVARGPSDVPTQPAAPAGSAAEGEPTP
jgi:hypothetical protein